jgi:hypothetical protein
VRWQTGNGANFSLFWERDTIGILPKKAEVIISGALSLVRLPLANSQELFYQK